jgi:hypothetical protein
MPIVTRPDQVESGPVGVESADLCRDYMRTGYLKAMVVKERHGMKVTPAHILLLSLLSFCYVEHPLLVIDMVLRASQVV